MEGPFHGAATSFGAGALLRLGRVNLRKQFAEIVPIVETVSASKAIPKTGQVLLGQQAYSDDGLLALHLFSPPLRNGTRTLRALNSPRGGMFLQV